MAGKKGASGRKKGSGMTAAEHAARGTYRPDRHGPLDFSLVSSRPVAALGPLPSADVATSPDRFLTADDCPAAGVLDDAGRAFWLDVITSRPVETLHAQIVVAYVQAWQDWQRSTKIVRETGDILKLAGRPIPNPHIALRREAYRAMIDAARFMGWQTKDPGDLADKEAPTSTVSRLGLFLASRNNL